MSGVGYRLVPAAVDEYLRARARLARAVRGAQLDCRVDDPVVRPGAVELLVDLCATHGVCTESAVHREGKTSAVRVGRALCVALLW